MIFDKENSIVLPTYKEQAYKLIKEAIIFQRFKPDEMYSQEEICKELGISRTPVREALLELQREHYICFCRGRGISVLPITEAEAKAILEMRINNEKFGAKLAAQRATENQIEKIERLLDEAKQVVNSGCGTELYKLDRDFHNAVMEASQNGWLQNSVNDLRDQCLRFENQIAYDVAVSANQIIGEHYNIFQNIKEKNADGAEMAMNGHLLAAYQRTMSKYLP